MAFPVSGETWAIFRGVGKGQRAKFRHKFSVLTPVSRTISSEWAGKGRPGLPWLAATSGLCRSTDGWVPEAPRYPVPPPHSPLSTTMALSYRLPSLPRFCVASRAVLAGPAVQQRLLQSCLWLARPARPGPGRRRGPGPGQPRGQQVPRTPPSARPLAAGTRREPSAGTRDATGCSGPFWNLPETAANQEGASQVRFPPVERVLVRVLVWRPARPRRRSPGGIRCCLCFVFLARAVGTGQDTAHPPSLEPAAAAGALLGAQAGPLAAVTVRKR